jgi:hypothetical protein
VIEALVGTKHHSTTRQAGLHSGLVGFLFPLLDILEAVRTLNNTVRTVGLVIGQVLAEDRSLAVLTIQNLKLALLTEKRTSTRKALRGQMNERT